MTGNRLWTIGVAVVIAAVVVMGWFLAISPVLTQATASDTQAQGIIAQNSASDASIATLAGESKRLPQQQKILSALQAAAPESANLDDFLDQLQALAQANGVTITSFTAAEAAAYGGAAGAAAAVPAPAAATPAPSASGDAAATPDTSAAATAATGGALAGKLFTIPITLALTGPSEQVLAFTKAAQTGIRFFLVTGVTFTVTAGTLSGSIFVLRESLPATAAGAASSTGTPVVTPTPMPTSTPTPTPTATPSPTESVTPTPSPTPTP